MAARPRFIFLPRDREILTALARTPLTAEQLLRLSRAFGRAFADVRRVRERMADLASAGLVCPWPLAREVGGSRRLLYGLGRAAFPILFPGAEPPRARSFAPRPTSRIHHSLDLAEFVVKTALAAHDLGVDIIEFGGEGSVRMDIDGELLVPDATFQLRTADQVLSFFLEIDEASERLRSKHVAESWERKIRLYERLQDISEPRFRVLVATTGGKGRLQHILGLASMLAKNPQRSLIYATSLNAFLDAAAPLSDAVFLNHRQSPVALIPPLSAHPHQQRSAAIACPEPVAAVA